MASCRSGSLSGRALSGARLHRGDADNRWRVSSSAIPASYATVEKSVLAYWVGPGLAEVRIYDRLRTAGLNVVLYPDEDAADVGTADFRLGIDVKTYGSPVMLARRLSAGIGGLGPV